MEKKKIFQREGQAEGGRPENQVRFKILDFSTSKLLVSVYHRQNVGPKMGIFLNKINAMAGPRAPAVVPTLNHLATNTVIQSK